MKWKVGPIEIAALALLAVLAGVYFVTAKKPAPAENHAPVEAIEWRPASSLPTGYEVSQNYTWYSLQNGVVYCMFEQKLEEADTATFVASSLDGYGKDKNHVYWCDTIVAEADPDTFTILSKEYAKDTDHVFYVGGSIIAGADPATFTAVTSPEAYDPLQTGFGKDRSHVYWMDHAIPGADPATFAISPVVRDKDWIYINDMVVGPTSLISDNAQYAESLPPACNPQNAETIYPQPYPTAFSADGGVVGYASDFRICIIDKKATAIQTFPYGTQDGVSISKDGSRLLYFKYQKGDGEGEQTCADCRQYSLDRATGTTTKIGE